MSRAVIIPDVHLKPRLFDIAEQVINSGNADFAIQLGDMVDDWGEGFNISLYGRTLQRAIKFQEDHPDTLWVMGNHDYGYWKANWGVRETGHSKFVEDEVLSFLQQLERKGGQQKIMHIVDGCIFTHAGLSCEWVERQRQLVGMENSHIPDRDELLRLVNNASADELWQENSPIWWRPQEDTTCGVFPCKLQVVGHTPVGSAIEEDGVLSTDTFSTYRNGAPIGDGRMVIIDTEKGTWSYA